MFLRPDEKKPKLVNISIALHNAVATSFGEEPAAKVKPACEALQHLRSVVGQPPGAHGTGMGLLNYHRALRYILDECCILGDTMSTTSTSTSSSNSWTLPLLWPSSLDLEAFSEIADLRLDVLCTLFNLGINEAQRASDSYQNVHSDGLRNAAKQFQAAAGYFDLAAQMPTPGGVEHTSSDIWPTTLQGLCHTMLGNAQSVFLEICDMNNASMPVQARLAAGAREFYKRAAESFRSSGHTDPMVMEMLGVPASALSAYFNLLSLSKAAAGARKSSGIGAEIARLVEAQKLLKPAILVLNEMEPDPRLLSVKKIREHLTEELHKMGLELQERETEAREENRKFYFETVPDKLPAVVPHESVKPAASVKDVLNAVSVDARLKPFSDLPKMQDGDGNSAGSMAGRYSLAAEGYIKNIVAKADTVTANARVMLGEIEKATKESRDEVNKMARLATDMMPRAEQIGSGGILSLKEQRAVDAVRFVKNKGGAPVLRDQQMQVHAIGKKALEELNAVEQMLREEEEEDEKLRVYAPGRRPSSMQLTSHLRGKVGQVRTNLEAASNADKYVGRQVDEYAAQIAALLELDVNAAVAARLGSARRAKEMMRDKGEANEIDMIANRLGALTREAHDLMKRKDSAIQALENARRKQNPLVATASLTDVSGAGSGADAEVDAFEQVLNNSFGTERSDVETACDQLANNMGAVRDELERLRELKEGATKITEQVNEGIQGIKSLFEHETAALKFAECIEHLQQGASFYEREGETVQAVAAEVKRFCEKRNEEFQRIMNENQSGGGDGGSFAPNFNKSYYPGGGPSGAGSGFMPNAGPFYPTGGGSGRYPQ